MFSWMWIPFPRAVNFPALGASLDELLFHTQQIGEARGLPLGEVRVLSLALLLLLLLLLQEQQLLLLPPPPPLHTNMIQPPLLCSLQAKVKIDEATNEIVTQKFPSLVRSPRAQKLGLPKDGSVEEVVQQFVDDFFEDEMLKEYPLV